MRILEGTHDLLEDVKYAIEQKLRECKLNCVKLQ